MKIILAADHGGYQLKNKIKEHLVIKGHEVDDFGPNVYNNDDDYPDYVIPAMDRMMQNPNSFAVLVCRNGVGVSMLANKFKGIRCSLSHSSEHVVSARKDDNINALAIGADYTIPHEAIKMVDALINTTFSNQERHIRRLNKIKNIAL